jgi:hypothetical protein
MVSRKKADSKPPFFVAPRVISVVAGPAQPLVAETHKADVRFGSWLRENSEIEFANGNFVSASINLKNNSAGDGCRDKTI